MTLDREIRLTPEQITVAQRALRDEARKHSRSICKAEELRAAGNKIQQNVLDSHYRELKAAQQVLEALDVAQRQIQHRIREKLNLDG